MKAFPYSRTFAIVEKIVILKIKVYILKKEYNYTSIPAPINEARDSETREELRKLRGMAK